MERTISLNGLGEFIKDIDDIQFLFVGIGETVSSIIKDHQSAGRKLAGNDFEAPLLSEKEIREIFNKAIEKSRGKLTISENYLIDVVKYSGGVPWIAQHVGYQSVFKKQQEANSTDTNLYLDEGCFKDSLETVMRVHQHDQEIKTQLENIEEWGATEFELLSIFWNNPNGVTEEDARKMLPPNLKQFFDKALKRIEDSRIISRRKHMLYFFNPALRLFVKFKIDNYVNS